MDFGNPLIHADRFIKGDDSHIRKDGAVYNNDTRPIDNTPINLAGVLILAGAVLFLLKMGGFRFSFGVGAGGK